MITSYDAELASRDTAIPGLALLLDPEAFHAALCRALPGARIDTLHPEYVRYKPGMNCLVAYTAIVDGEAVPLYAKAHRPDARDQLRKVLEAAAQPGAHAVLGPGKLVLGEHATVVFVFPNDGELKTLSRLAQTHTWEHLLQRVFTSQPDLANGTVSSIRYKPERRFVAQLSAGGSPRAVLKVYTDSGYAEARRNVRAFKSRDVLRVPRRLGHSDRHNMLAFEWMEGQLLSEVLSGSNLDLAAIARVGAALAEGHAQSVGRLVRLSRESEASTLLSVAAGLAFLRPQMAARTNKLARQLAAHILQAPEQSVPVHGDFYAKQVLLAGDKVVILDLDSAVAGDPAFDLGLFIAHLERGGLRRSLPSDRVVPVAEALLQGYGAASRHSAGPTWDAHVGLYTAAGLLKLAPHPFRNRQREWPAAIDANIARAEVVLEQAEARLRAFTSYPGPAHDQSGVIVQDPYNAAADPAMPFLVQALNPVDIRLQFKRRLEAFFGHDSRVDLLGVRVLRHKPGRRCLIEYELVVERPDAPPQAITLVGKSRARGLDHETYGTLVALWRGGFSDLNSDGVGVPEPVGMVPEFQMWLHRKVPGVPATQLLAGEQGVATAKRVAEATYRLHRAGVRPHRRHTMADELRILHERLSMLAQERPELSARLERVLAGCGGLASSLPRPHTTGIHRDFYSDQVLVDGDHLYLIDFDLYCEGDPALDIGNFLGHIQEQSLRTLDDISALSDRESALEETYLALAGEELHAAVQAYTTLTLVRHIQLSTRFPDRKAFTADLLELCEQRLSAYLPASRPRPSASRAAVLARES